MQSIARKTNVSFMKARKLTGFFVYLYAANCASCPPLLQPSHSRATTSNNSDDSSSVKKANDQAVVANISGGDDDDDEERVSDSMVCQT